MNYVFLITESYVRVVTNYCVVLFTDNSFLTWSNNFGFFIFFCIIIFLYYYFFVVLL